MPVKLTGLRPQAYEHPSDKLALDALSKNGGFDTLIRKLNTWGFERFLRIELTGSYLRVVREGFGNLHSLLERACDILDMPSLPLLYIAPGMLNAFTAGVDRPIVVLNSGLIDAMTEPELLFVIAHELGHIKSAHVLYYQVAKFLPALLEQTAQMTLGLSNIFGTGLEITLLHWQRMSEFTADRAGLLGCQDANAALRALMKLAGLPSRFYAGMNTEDFVAQAQEFHAMDQDKLTLIAKLLLSLDATHPHTVERGKQLLDWHDSGEYGRVLNCPQGMFCHHCDRPIQPQQAFCTNCGGRRLVAHASS